MSTPFEPYSAPPRSSTGRTCLFVGIGCVGLVVLATLALAAFFTVRVKEAASAPRLTAQQVNTVLPADVPVHPGLVFDELRTHQASSGLRVVKSFVKKTSLGQMHQLIFTAPNGVKPSLDWYRSTLPKRGWKYIETPASNVGPIHTETHQFMKNDTMLMMTHTSTEPKVLTMTVMKGMPKPSAPPAKNLPTPVETR